MGVSSLGVSACRARRCSVTPGGVYREAGDECVLNCGCFVRAMSTSWRSSPRQHAHHAQVPQNETKIGSTLPQLVLPHVAEKTAQHVSAEQARKCVAPATTAAYVRREAQRGLMEERDIGIHPAGRVDSRGSTCSVYLPSAGNLRTSVRTSASRAPAAPPGPSDRSRKMLRRRQVAEAATERSTGPFSAAVRHPADQLSSAIMSTSQGESPDRPPSNPGTVAGVICGVPFQTCAGGFGALVDHWLNTTNKALSPNARLRAKTQNDPRQNVAKQKAKVEKARANMRRAVDNISNMSDRVANKSTAGRGRGHGRSRGRRASRGPNRRL